MIQPIVLHRTPKTVPRYHVTVLSNFARGFDKYAMTYSKAAIAESTFPDRFFLLDAHELHHGVRKASGLLPRTGHPNDRLLVLETRVDPGSLHVNSRTGIGRYVEGPTIRLSRLWLLAPVNETTSTANASHAPWSTEGWTPQPLSVEEAYAASMALWVAHDGLTAYDALRPRTVSVLPLARACQARCRFCFSDASVSMDQAPHRNPLVHEHWHNVQAWVEQAAARGAERFVITGGGEPGLLPHKDLLRLIRLGASRMRTVVLITNGIHLARLDELTIEQRLRDYRAAGLSVLSLSRHHHEVAVNAGIMGLDTKTESVLNAWQRVRSETLATNVTERRPMSVRLIAVLQKGGVEDDASLSDYLDWAVQHGVAALCFKELYVSSTLESAYHAQPANGWAREHQVPLVVLTAFLERHGFQVVERLPWGSPVYRGSWQNQTITVAAYTEPTLFWERHHGIARSWNLMADGQCLVSLEDPSSGIALPSDEPVVGRWATARDAPSAAHHASRHANRIALKTST